MSDINDKAPFFSVVIPVYNGEGCIEGSVGSVLSQTFEDLEVVVINDGSTDATAEVLEGLSLKDSRLRVITTENRGVFSARARGAAESRGTYLLYCDDDDELCDDTALERLYEHAKNEEFDLIQYGYIKVFGHISVRDNTVKEAVEVSAEEFYQREYPFLLSSRNIASRLMVNTVTKAYHKRIYRNAPAYEGLERMFMGDDMVMNLYFLKDCKRALYLPECFYRSYRLRGSSAGYRRNEMHNLDAVKGYQLRFLSDWQGKDRDKVLYLHHYEVADWLFAHIRSAVKAEGAEAAASLLSEVLELPAFKRAQEYFSALDERDDVVELFLNAGNDPHGYVLSAKMKRDSLKTRLYSFIKEKIIYKI